MYIDFSALTVGEVRCAPVKQIHINTQIVLENICSLQSFLNHL